LGKASARAINSVVFGMFGRLIRCQPGGVGIDTVRSVNVPGSTGEPVTPLLSRYCENGIGRSVGAALVVVGVVDQID
jgi:hypothetical protein